MTAVRDVRRDWRTPAGLGPQPRSTAEARPTIAALPLAHHPPSDPTLRTPPGARASSRRPTAIEVEHLTKRYGGMVAVEDVSFDVAEGEIFGILGPNGAGRTTTVECVEGLRQPTGGRVVLLGYELGERPRALRQRIGSQLQDSALPDRIKVWEALDLFSSMAGTDTDWRVLLEQWGLAGKERAVFSSLSGGQRQRLLVALALVNSPDVVFLDEMTQGLDPAARRVAWGLIRSVRDRGTTVVLVTHYIDEAEALCDRLAIVDRGRVAALGTPQELIARSAGGIRVRFTTDARDVSWLAEVEHVEKVVHQGVRVEVVGSGPVLVLVAAALVSRGIVPGDLRVVQATLEDVYLELIGQAVKEDR